MKHQKALEILSMFQQMENGYYTANEGTLLYRIDKDKHQIEKQDDDKVIVTFIAEQFDSNEFTKVEKIFVFDNRLIQNIDFNQISSKHLINEFTYCKTQQVMSDLIDESLSINNQITELIKHSHKTAT